MKYFTFKSVPPKAIHPRGLVLDFLKRQQKGLSGNFESQGFPFNTPMWDGGVGKIFAASIIHGDKSAETPGQSAWWPYEQTAYLLDGIFKLSVLLGDRKLFNTAERNFRYLLEHSDKSGLLGRCYGDIDLEWPLAVFMRALSCYGRVTENPDVERAIIRHYTALPKEILFNGTRHIINLESLLLAADRNDHVELISKALSAYRLHDQLKRGGLAAENTLNWSKFTGGTEFSIHGVTFSEEIKLPVLLFGATNERKFLDKAVEALDRILERHEQLPGLPSSNEYLSGRDPMQGYESCLITDFTLALVYYLQATGDGKYADRIEKIIWNALPGAVTKDFSGLQYFSGPNQTAAASWSNHNYFYRGSASFRQYRPNHSAQCCPGNIHRAMPNYALAMFMVDKDNAPVAALYGATEYSGCRNGFNYTIAAETDYPFQEAINFRFSVSEGGSLPFTFRIPNWCKNPALELNGKKIDLPECKKGFCRLEDLHDGDSLGLTLPCEVIQVHERQWSFFERGVLLYSLPVASECRRQGSGRFAARELTPKSAWNYAVRPETKAKTIKHKIGNDPWANPPVKLKLSGFLSSGWDALVNGRFTPNVPLFTHRIGPQEQLKLVPYGCHELRVTAFPDAARRELLPVYQVLAQVAGEKEALPEISAFKRTAAEIQLTETGYCDLLRYFSSDATEEPCAWVCFRFIAPDNGRAIMALGASTHAEAYVNSQYAAQIPYPFDAEFFEPLWFNIQVKAGYNELMLKVHKGYHYFQYPLAWGARVQIFKERQCPETGV